MVATWDDHEYNPQGPDACKAVGCNADNPYKDAAKSAFLNFWEVPAEASREDSCRDAP